MGKLFRGAAAGALTWLLLLSPSSPVAQSLPGPGSSPAEDLSAICDQAAQEFLNAFEWELDQALAQGHEAGFRLFRTRLAQLEQGFSNPKIQLRLKGRKSSGLRNGRPDLFDTTAMSGFARAGKQSAAKMGFFLNPEGRGREFRFYREVRARKSCLACHGPRDQVAPQVRKLMKEDYPGYDGLGFKEGEVLGVVGIRVLAPPIK